MNVSRLTYSGLSAATATPCRALPASTSHDTGWGSALVSQGNYALHYRAPSGPSVQCRTKWGATLGNSGASPHEDRPEHSGRPSSKVNATAQLKMRLSPIGSCCMTSRYLTRRIGLCGETMPSALPRWLVRVAYGW